MLYAFLLLVVTSTGAVNKKSFPEICSLLWPVGHTGKRGVCFLEKLLQITTGRERENKGSIRHHSMEISQWCSLLMLCLVLKFKRYCSLTCFPWLEFITANRAEPQGELLDMHWQEQTVTAWKSAHINVLEEPKSGWRMHFPAMPRGVSIYWLARGSTVLFFLTFQC